MYLLYIFPPELHIPIDFVVLTSLTHPRKIILLVLQIGKVKDLSAALRSDWLWAGWPGFDSRQGQEICLYFTASRPALGPTQTI
jgi:hypothetical protein